MIREKQSWIVAAAMAALSIPALSEPAAAQDSAVATKRVSSADGKVSFEVPKTWETKVEPNDPFVLSVDCRVGANVLFRLLVFQLPRTRDAAGHVHYERKPQADRHEIDVADTVVKMSPVPHLTFEYEYKQQPLRAYYGYRRVGRQAFSISTEELPVDGWKWLEPHIHHVVASLETELTSAQPCPEGYEEWDVDGVQFHVHPEVSKKDLRRVRKRFGKLRERFEEDFGALRIEEGNPGIVVVHPNGSRSRQMCPAAADSKYGQHEDYISQRLFLVPWDTEDPFSESAFVEEIEKWLLMEQLGVNIPEWIWQGTVDMTVATAWTGKELVIPATMGPKPRSLPPLEELSAGDKTSMWWVMFLRRGPAAYQKAFRACLADAYAARDWEAALGKHLLSMDQGKLRKDAATFVKKKLKLAGH